LQEEQLFNLIGAAAKTSFGKKYRFEDLQRYEEFAAQVPISFYDDISDHIEEIKEGKSNLYWPGSVNRFAVSSGTSGLGKHLPLTKERLKADRRFMRKVTWSYLRQHPNIFKLWGRHISLPGSLEQHSEYEIGEISAFTANQMPWWLAPFQLIPTEELIPLPFSKKIDRIIEQAIHRDIRVISAVPSWLLTIFQRVLQQTDAESIAEVWPKLRLLVCGGVKLVNYRPLLQKLLGQNVDFVETYGASEGYFAFTDDLRKDDLRLVIDNGMFYEFIPNPLPEPDSLSIQPTVPLWEVETGIPYAVIVTTNAGLWRYALNDIITFTETNPPRINVEGRVSEMLDDFGEALYSYEAEQSLRKAAEDLDIEIGTFTIAARLDENRSVPCHTWFVQTYDPLHPDTLNRLSQKLDDLLRKRNRHYNIRRESDALGMPQTITIDQRQINRWLQSKGKEKAQGKLPQILRDEEDIFFFK
jgi:phenylacetate-coenzyme A ligase PaaK-like adenylate-forming protein